MQMKQMGSLRRSAQAGFTLIELIVVIVILGILAATALPKFADMGSDARAAKLKGARGAVQSAASLARAKWLVGGTGVAGDVMLDTTAIAVNANGYPTGESIATAANISSSDFGITPTAATAIFKVNATATTQADCKFTYTAATGTVDDIDPSKC